MNYRILFIALAVWLVSIVKALASESVPYAIYNYSEQTLTFRYDKNKPTEAFGLGHYYDKNVLGKCPLWYQCRTGVKTVIFDGSFANYRPTDCTSWFYGFENLQSIIGLENLNTSETVSLAYMFFGCNKLTSLNLSTFDTKNVRDMNNMFFNCIKLESLDVSKFNTSNVRDMSYMFTACGSLTSLDLSNFDTQNVRNMAHMFTKGGSLKSIDVSHFLTSNVYDMSYMFSECSALKLLDVSHFDTHGVKYMDGMFNQCKSLPAINVSNFNTANVLNMNRMFANCHFLTTLDLSSFKTDQVKAMGEMFYNCIRLRTIYASEKFNTTSLVSLVSELYETASTENRCFDRDFNLEVFRVNGLFRYCKALKGAIAYKEDEQKFGSKYANYKTGYFTYKKYHTPSPIPPIINNKEAGSNTEDIEQTNNSSFISFIPRGFRFNSNALYVEYPTDGPSNLVDAIRQYINLKLGGGYPYSLSDPKQMVQFYGLGLDPAYGYMLIKRLYENDEIITLGCKQYVRSDGGGGITYEYGVTFRKKDGKPFTQKMLNAGPQTNEAILKGLRGFFHVTTNKELFQFAESIPVPVHEPWITEDGVNFYYDRGLFTTFATNDYPKFTIPVAEMIPCLSEEGRTFLK